MGRDLPSSGTRPAAPRISLFASILVESPSNLGQCEQTMTSNVAQSIALPKRIAVDFVKALCGPRHAISSDHDLIHSFALLFMPTDALPLSLACFFF